MQYRRARIKGGTYFFTVVTHKRAKILCESENVVLLREAFKHVMNEHLFTVRHVEYIHYNPVKHGLVPAPKDWEYSSFHRYVRNGIYDLEWAAGQDIAFSIAVGNE